MKAFALTLLALCALALCGPAEAQYRRSPGCGTLPAYTPYRTTYAAPAYAAPAVYAPAKTTYAPSYQTHDYATTIRFADAVFQVTDYNVRDLFVFTGPPARIPVGVTFGVAASGKEILAPVAASPAKTPGVWIDLPDGTRVDGVKRPIDPYAAGVVARADAARKVVADDQSTDAGAPLEGYTPDAEIAKLPAKAASSRLPADDALTRAMRASCASCHTAGSQKGGLTLFTGYGSAGYSPLAPIDAAGWKAILEAVTSADGKSAPRMPPAGKGTPLSADAVAAIRERAAKP